MLGGWQRWCSSTRLPLPPSSPPCARCRGDGAYLFPRLYMPTICSLVEQRALEWHTERIGV